MQTQYILSAVVRTVYSIRSSWPNLGEYFCWTNRAVVWEITDSRKKLFQIRNSKLQNWVWALHTQVFIHSTNWTTKGVTLSRSWWIYRSKVTGYRCQQIQIFQECQLWWINDRVMTLTYKIKCHYDISWLIYWCFIYYLFLFITSGLSDCSTLSPVRTFIILLNLVVAQFIEYTVN